MAAKQGGRLHWGVKEYDLIARACAPLVKEGQTMTQAVTAAQMVLPKDRRHTRVTLQGESIQKNLRIRMVKRGLLTKAEAYPQTARRKVIRWDPIEWALVARRVKYWRDTLKDSRPLLRLIVAAQEVELPPDRHRPMTSISVNTVPGNGRRMSAALKDPKLLAHNPFEPTAAAYEPPAPAAPKEPPRKVFEFIDPAKLAEASAKPSSSPQAATNPQGSTIPPTNPAAAPGALTFTVTAGPAVVELLRTMVSQAVANELDARIPSALVKITSHLQTSIASMLTHFLDAKPGDMVAAPPAPAMPPEVPAAQKAIHEVKLPLLDVVGLIGPQINQVKDTLNGHARSVRFVDADHVDSWTPRGVVILNTKFISHNAENKCKKAGVKPIRVNGGADAVLRALNELYVQQAGAPAALAAAHH